MTRLHTASAAVDSLGRIVVSNLAQGIANNLVHVHLGGGRDFSEQQDIIRLGRRLTSHLAVGVLGQAGVQNGVGNLVAALVRMALANRLAGKEKHFLGGGHGGATKVRLLPQRKGFKICDEKILQHRIKKLRKLLA